MQIDINGINVAFVGNHLPIKNVQYLPKLFLSIYQVFPDAVFHIIGSGDFEKDYKESPFPVKYWENQSPEKMPDLYNSMDLVVMPSLKEGLPMTCLESTACGTAFVGSRVGDIADVVGIENTVPFSSTFETDFANLCKKRLANKNTDSIQLPEQYRVEHIVAEEERVLLGVING